MKCFINEMIVYILTYRNKSNVNSLKKVVLDYYSPTEITEGKRVLLAVYMEQIQANMNFVTDRRNSVLRAAQEADLDDILAALDYLDSAEALNATFAAVAADRMPKYGPEELNICAVVDRQLRCEATLQEILKSGVADDSAVHVASVVKENISKGEELSAKLDVIASNLERRFDQLSDVCGLVIKASSSGAVAVAKPNYPVAERHRPEVADDSRALNIVISGIPEDKNATIWRGEIEKVLTCAASRDVEISDAFRIGGKFSSDKTRPILVRLRSAWDKRLVLSGARKLSREVEFRRRVYISPDEPLEIRRKNTLERLKSRAIRESKEVDCNVNGVLVIDGVQVFSLKDGYLNLNLNVRANVPQSNDG